MLHHRKRIIIDILAYRLLFPKQGPPLVAQARQHQKMGETIHGTA